MAGPGGGSRGGGFSGGGSGGGSFGGGGYHGGFYRRPFFGGGLFGGILGIILLPAILIILGTVILVFNLINTIQIISQGGQIVYDEEKLQDYAAVEYDKYFTDKTTYEDNLLIVVLTTEENEEYSCIAWVGDNIKTDINDMFGNEETEFGRAVKGSISPNYKYSLDSNLARVMGEMEQEILSLDLKSSFKTNNDMSNKSPSKLVNYTDLQMTDKTVNDSLNSFTEKTGIPAVIVVDEAETVFGKTMPIANIVLLVAVIALIAFCVYYMIKKIVEKRRVDRDFQGTNNFNGGYGGNGYNSTYGNGSSW